MRINNNLMAMNTHRQMGINQANSAKSIAKLSSGLRINNAADDAAGLAISEKMRSQIRGLNQASRNAQDGISMVQTAEGALQETQAILQRMRELSVQSANGTNEDTDRSALQSEISQLNSEINRIAETTEFNKQSLLQGDGGVAVTATGVTDLAGALANGETDTTEATVTVTTAALVADSNATHDADTLEVNLNGAIVTLTFAADATLADGATNISDVTGTSATINFDATTAGVSDANWTDALASALTQVIAENSELDGNYTAVNTGDNLVVSATSTGDYAGASGAIEVDVSAADSLTATTTADVGTTTNYSAFHRIDFNSLEDTDAATTDANLEALVGTGMTINGTAVEFYNSNDGAYTGDAIGVDISDALYESTYTSKAEALVDSIVSQVGSQIEGTSLVAGDGATTYGSTPVTPAAGELVVVATATGEAGNGLAVSDGATVDEEFSTSFQIGANDGQTMEVTINDMRNSALGIENVDISTADGAKSAIDTIQSALTKVSDERAKLGAFQNRLEHSIKNLDASSENLVAAESRIRDVDMAKEMMNFQKNNILQQAAQSMLAQANQAPQGVLQLLR